MKEAAREAFIPMTVAFEGGYINWMFPDVKGLVSTGFGLMLEPIQSALALPWKRADGSPASPQEIVDDWNRVKNYPDAARLGHRSVEHVAQLRLTNEGIDHAVSVKIAQNESYLRQGFPQWDSWPADAQLGALSMAWAVGPAFWQSGWPKLTAALRAQDFRTAALECFLPEEKTIGGLRPRNRANRILFTNAAMVKEQGLNPEALYYPKDLGGAANIDPVAAVNKAGSKVPLVVLGFMGAATWWFMRNKG